MVLIIKIIIPLVKPETLREESAWESQRKETFPEKFQEVETTGTLGGLLKNIIVLCLLENLRDCPGGEASTTAYLRFTGRPVALPRSIFNGFSDSAAFLR